MQPSGISPTRSWVRSHAGSERKLRLLLQRAEAETARRAEREQKRLAVNIHQFLNDPYYLGNTRLWPEVKAEIERIVATNPHEVTLPWATGAGKSALGGALFAWIAHRILPAVEDRSFFWRYELKGDKSAYMLQLATNLEQTKDNIFSETRPPILNSPWFQEHYPADPNYSSRLVFTWPGLDTESEGTLIIQPLGGGQRGPLAYDPFVVAIDEASWFVESPGVLGDSAEVVYEQMSSRMTSRFGDGGMLLNLSAPKHKDDFTQRRAADAEKGEDPSLYASRRALWETRPDHIEALAAGDFFETAHPETGEAVRIPKSLARRFAANPELSWRNFGGVPQAASGALFDLTAAQWLEACATLTSLPGPNAQRVYYVHGDLALTQDRATLGMAHPEPDGRAVLDRVVEIPKRADTQAVEIDDVLQRILQWRAQGFSIAEVTCDQFQSADLLQRVHRHGMKTRTLSVDSGLEPYNCLKTALHEERFAYCPTMQNAAMFCDEYTALELVKGTKVDHAPGKSKDFADAVCGATYNAVQNAGQALPMSERMRIL